MQAYTTEEKIDYIYKTLKKNERNSLIWGIFKWGFRLALLGYLYYFMTVWVPAMIDNIVPKFNGFWWGESNISADEVKELISIPQMQELLDSYMNK